LALPNASFIGFTGTPNEKTDANTRTMGSPSNALVAFTDVVKDAKDGQEYTEAKMNGFPEAATGDIEKRMNDEAGHFVRRSGFRT